MSTAMAGEDELLVGLAGATAAVLGAAVAAGLTIGLVSLDSLDLLVIVESDLADCGSEEERRELAEEKVLAEMLLPLLENRHRLLVTLLVLNSLCVEALPIFLDRLVPTTVAVLLGVIFLLIFGEILPSAFFTGPLGMRAAARFAPLARFFLFVLAPVAVPVGRFLDWWVGDDEEKSYSRSELLALLRLHTGKTGGKLITVRQSRMMQGAMDLMHLTAGDVMTTTDNLFMLSTETELNIHELALVVGKGYSRVPVFEGQDRNNVRGILLTKSLAVINPEDHIKVKNLFPRTCPCISPLLSLYDVMSVMKATRSHICLVSDDPMLMSRRMSIADTSETHMDSERKPRLLGAVSLHDIVACVVDSNIADEYTARRGNCTESTDDESLELGGDSPPVSRAKTPSPALAEEKKIEFKSEFAKQRVMRWLERARLTTQLQHSDGQSALNNNTERTHLLTHSTSDASQGLAVDQGKTAAVARRLMGTWLAKRTTGGNVTQAEVTRTLQNLPSNIAGISQQSQSLDTV